MIGGGGGTHSLYDTGSVDKRYVLFCYILTILANKTFLFFVGYGLCRKIHYKGHGCTKDDDCSLPN